MIRTFLLSLTVVILAVLALAGFRGQLSSKSPIQIFPDMKQQPRMEAQHTNRFFADGRSAREPIAGTVPLGYTLPGSYSTNSATNRNTPGKPGAEFGAGFSKSPDYFYSGRMGDVYGAGIPLEVNADLLARGQERYNIHCAPCHGTTGGGNGIVSQFGLNAIANFHQDRLRSMPDGQFFNRITHGFNTMGEYGQQIAVEDRWAIISFIRALQRSQNAKIDDVPQQLRASLDTQRPAAEPEAKK